MKSTTPLPPPQTNVVRRDTKEAAAPKLNGNSGVRIKSILVPIDFSPPSLKAMDYALTLAASTKAQITLLHVQEMVAMPEFAGYPLLLPTDATARSRRDELMRLAKQHGYTPSVLKEVKICNGTPYHEITTAARTLKIDLIVLATHGYTGLKHVLLGSTAERVVRHASCPVLVVPTRS